VFVLALTPLTRPGVPFTIILQSSWLRPPPVREGRGRFAFLFFYDSGAYANTDTNGLDGWIRDNCIYVICTNLTLQTGGQINADYKGFGGSTSKTSGNTNGFGPGGGTGANSNGQAGSIVFILQNSGTLILIR
jgi:hypothetical protein